MAHHDSLALTEHQLHNSPNKFYKIISIMILISQTTKLRISEARWPVLGHKAGQRLSLNLILPGSRNYLPPTYFRQIHPPKYKISPKRIKCIKKTLIQKKSAAHSILLISNAFFWVRTSVTQVIKMTSKLSTFLSPVSSEKGAAKHT